MSDAAIRVEGLWKEFVIGRADPVYKTFREALVDNVTRPFQRMLKSDEPEPSEDRFWALSDLNFEVRPGEIVGVIGRNGAGKSTLFKILSRITPPTKGRIDIRGRIASLLEVGTGFHPELTGRENIQLNGAILGMSRAEISRKFDEIVAFAEVERFLDTPVKRYSSGMYVRLAFAVAAHLEPEILIVDEVLAVGDSAFQKKCLAKMEDVSNCGRTVLFISHNMAAVRALCSRGIVLKNGRIEVNADIADAVESYLSNDYLNASSIVWPQDSAPACDAIRFTKAYILDSAGAKVGILQTNKSFSVCLEYELLSSVHQMRVGILIRHNSGVDICGSTDWGSWPDDIRPPGHYVSVCQFPADLLNEGRYNIEFAADATPHLTPLIRTDYCVSFDVEDFEGHGPRKQKLPGVIKPKLSWSATRA